MRIDSSVISVLSRSAVAGRTLTLPEQLDRQLYLQVNKVLEAIGAKWQRRDKCHLFDTDAEQLVDAVILSGEVVLPTTFDFFPTPNDVIDKLMFFARIRRLDRVLEPSAGDGAIAQYLKGLGCADVQCCEIQEGKAHKLRGLGFPVWHGDFMTTSPEPRFDRVVMNPPFSKRQEIHHVFHASKFLKPGGILAAVMSAGVVFREDKLTTSFRNFVANHGGSIEPLPDDSFRLSGTGVRTVITSFSMDG